MFGIKSYEICESFTGYLYQFTIYTGSSTEIQTDVVPAETIMITQMVVKLIYSFFKLSYTLWIDNSYKSPDLCLLLKENKMDVIGTLRLNRRHVPVALRQ